VNILSVAVCIAALALVPSTAVANCGDGTCEAGINGGTGGIASDGKAQGGRFQGEVDGTGASVTATGTFSSGTAAITNPDGSVQGTLRGDTWRGRQTGFFEDCKGLCDNPFDDLPF
jgi:hypothetical protein